MTNATNNNAAAKPAAKPAATTEPTQPTTVPAIHQYAPFILANCADAADFRANCADAVNAMRTPPRGMDKEERETWRAANAKAHRFLLRTFPVIEATTDVARHSIPVLCNITDASGTKVQEMRPVRLDDAIYARLGLYGRTVERVGLA